MVPSQIAIQQQQQILATQPANSSVATANGCQEQQSSRQQYQLAFDGKQQGNLLSPANRQSPTILGQSQDCANPQLHHHHHQQQQQQQHQSKLLGSQLDFGGIGAELRDDLTLTFGPDSEDTTDACEIEPSISFSHGVEELLFSEFIDLQDVPMNVDESDWLKKFLPPCSMG